jgi:hypothetical protein
MFHFRDHDANSSASNDIDLNPLHAVSNRTQRRLYHANGSCAQSAADRDHILNKEAMTNREVTAMTIKPPAAARKLQIAAARSLPLYARIARDAAYSAGLARSIQDKNFKRAENRIKRVLPKAEISVGAGFALLYAMGDTLLEIGIFRPNRIIHARDLQSVSKTMLPLMRKIIKDRCFALKLTALYLQRKPGELLKLARTIVPARRVAAAGIDHDGFHFVVRVPDGGRYNFIVNLH